MTSLLYRFQFVDNPVRGEICQLSSAYKEALSHHQYPPVIASMLGELMAAVALMANSLKFEGSLIIQAQGNGPASLLMAECTQAGELRAIAQYDEHTSALLTTALWTDWVGKGYLTLTIDPAEGERYQGIVPMEGASLAEALAHYFAQSEQLPTRFILAANGLVAGGLMLQVMPGHDQTHHDQMSDDDIWLRTTALADTLKPEELLGLTPEDVLYRLYNEEVVEVFEPQKLRFKCTCSRTRSEAALRIISPEELQAALDEQQGRIDVDCQFCRQRYSFDRVDVERLAHPAMKGSVNLQ